jgi:dipeptidyl aminopeptidase/acylaminoacyl peptidase
MKTSRQPPRYFVLASALLYCLLLSGGSALAAAAAPRGLTPEDLVAMERVSGLALSPDGKTLAYELRTTDMEANGGHQEIWLLDAAGQNPRQLTRHAASSTSPVWAPDGRSLYFLSSRSGSSQVWQVRVDGGEAQQVSDLPLAVDNLKLAPDGSAVLFSMEVDVDCPDPGCTAERLEQQKERKATGVGYNNGFVRHWDTWKDGRRRHLFQAPLQDGKFGKPVDLMRGMNADAPTRPWGDAGEVTFAPGGGVVFTARQGGPEEPWSTNFDLWYVSAPGRDAVNLTTANPAWDTTPRFSPDGKTLFWLAMTEPGYESDRFRILRADWHNGKPGAPVEVAPDWDRSPQSLGVASDGVTLLVHADHLGQRGLFAITAADGTVRELITDGSVAAEVEGGSRVYFSRSDLATPANIWSVSLAGGEPRQLTRLNRERLADIAMGEAEQFSFTGANGDRVHAWMVKPANFDPRQRYPVAFLIHGGPQGSFGNSFHYRWNPQTYAGAGYAAVMVDFHGSTGYGQAFCDAIRDNWGDWPLKDLQQGLATALQRYPWMDGDRVAALGASYGGYMINWIAGNWNDRFRALVNHDGLFDTAFMYYSTEEQWFVHREFGGAPHQSPESYARWNPALHVSKWKTPMLVIHGELDYRVPITQGLATFTALQQQRVPSRLLYYPDENHWVLKPHNSIQWHQEVLGWLDQWLK